MTGFLIKSLPLRPSIIRRLAVLLAMVCSTLVGFLPSAPCQSVSDYAICVSSVVQTNPPRISLSWLPDPRATNYTLYRKLRDATSWGSATGLATNATNYTDSNVSVGGAYEYRIRKLASTGITNYTGEGYLYAGIEVPVVESRGKIVLLVDNTHASTLAMELKRLQQDLAGDGWTVLRHDVSPADSVANIKSLIKSDYNADSANVKAVFLFGHIPVPYSGNLYPDGHTEHWGAWPADACYADMNGTWTDTSVNNSSANDARNRNVPGDGKFDQSSLPSDVELQVGRVDLANLPSFPLSEGELLRRYLNKDHNFRHQFISAQPRGLIDDNFGAFNGEAFAASGWRNFTPFFGSTNILTADWMTTFANESCLWGYGCGGGTFTSAGGIGATSDFAAREQLVVFTMLFGSWFGDWDSQDNFLRAPLAAPGFGLASAWAGRPYWMFHHMALGETIGFSTRLTQNNSTLYLANNSMRGVHIALMGDPTLRLHPVTPPSALVVIRNASNGVDLRWNPAPEPVAGYRVYRAATASGPFTRLNPSLITGTNYTDPLVSSNIYMVRAVKLQSSASGSYFNPSQGIFQSLDPSFAVPSLRLLQPADNAAFVAPAEIRIEVSSFDLAASITRVEFYANDQKLGENNTPPFSFVWSNASPGSYSLMTRAIYNGGTATNSTPVAIRIDAPPILQASRNSANLLLSWPANPSGYQLQGTPSVSPSAWFNITNAVQASNGFNFATVDLGHSNQFFRLIKP